MKVRIGPAGVLVVLSPIVGEVLNGATRLSYIAALAPQIMVWGCGTLLARELALRRGGGWRRLLPLAAILSILVEFLVLQTSAAPIPWLELAGIPVYDRVGGVNWLWFVYMLGYEIVWVVFLPILIVELMYPDRRYEPWLGRPALAAVGAVFVAGCLGLWFLWTRIVIPQSFSMPVYDLPATTGGVAILSCALLAAAAYAQPDGAVTRRAGRRATSPGVVTLSVLGLALPWWALIVLVFVPQPAVPLIVSCVVAAAWATAACGAVLLWSAAADWSDRHRWALAFGGLLASMLAGFLGSQFWPRIDLVAKVAMNIVAVAAMLQLRRTISRRTSPQAATALPLRHE